MIAQLFIYQYGASLPSLASPPDDRSEPGNYPWHNKIRTGIDSADNYLAEITNFPGHTRLPLDLARRRNYGADFVTGLIAGNRGR